MTDKQKSTLTWTLNLIVWSGLAVMNLVRQTNLWLVPVYALIAILSLVALISGLKASKKNK